MEQEIKAGDLVVCEHPVYNCRTGDAFFVSSVLDRGTRLDLVGCGWYVDINLFRKLSEQELVEHNIKTLETQIAAQTEEQFKVGDYVKCIDSFDSFGLNEYSVYEVDEVDYQGLQVKGLVNFFYSTRFVKATQKEILQYKLSIEKNKLEQLKIKPLLQHGYTQTYFKAACNTLEKLLMCEGSTKGNGELLSYICLNDTDGSVGVFYRESKQNQYEVGFKTNSLANKAITEVGTENIKKMFEVFNRYL